MPCLNLPLGGHGLFAGRKSRMRLAANGAGQAEVGTVPSFRIVGASASRFAVLDGALRERAAAHEFNIGQFGGKLMHTMRNLGRGNSSVRRSIELLLEPQDEWDGRGAPTILKYCLPKQSLKN